MIHMQNIPSIRPTYTVFIPVTEAKKRQITQSEHLKIVFRQNFIFIS